MLAFLALAHAVPVELTHTGRLLDSAGLPLSGGHDLTFTIYDAQTGGTQLWSETRTVTLDEGYYAEALGELASNQIDDSHLTGGLVFIGVTVDGGTELPRQRISSVPYARLAGGVNGGVVDASEIRVDGNVVIDGSGTFVGTSNDTLAGLSCSANQVAVFDGTDWGCGSAGGGSVSWSDITGVPAGLLDDDDDTVGALVCSLGDILVWNDGAGAWGCGPGFTAADAVAAVNADLVGALGTIDDANPAHHVKFLAADAIAAVNGDLDAALGAVGNGNPAHHIRYADSEAVAAVFADLPGALGAVADGNPAHHMRYGDAEAVSAVNADLVGALGAVADTNAAHHDRYDDGEAVAAVNADLVGALGAIADSNPAHHDKFTPADLIAMGVLPNLLHNGGFETAWTAAGNQSIAGTWWEAGSASTTRVVGALGDGLQVNGTPGSDFAYQVIENWWDYSGTVSLSIDVLPPPGGAEVVIDDGAGTTSVTIPAGLTSFTRITVEHTIDNAADKLAVQLHGDGAVFDNATLVAAAVGSGVVPWTATGPVNDQIAALRWYQEGTIAEVNQDQWENTPAGPNFIVNFVTPMTRTPTLTMGSTRYYRNNYFGGGGDSSGTTATPGASGLSTTVTCTPTFCGVDHEFAGGWDSKWGQYSIDWTARVTEATY